MMFRRRKMKKTDYRKRIALVKSGKVRLVVRKSLSNVKIQFVKYGKSGDSVMAEVCSKDLKKRGWKGHAGNMSSAYLCGYLAGKFALKAGVPEAVLDMGVQSSHSKGALFAAAKGVYDSGVNIQIGEGAVPDESRLKGEHIAKYASLLKNDKEKYMRQFSQCIRNGLEPEKYPAHFEEVKRAIDSGDGE